MCRLARAPSRTSRDDYVANTTFNHLISHAMNVPEARALRVDSRARRDADLLQIILRAAPDEPSGVVARRQAAIVAALIYRGRMRSSSHDHERGRPGRSTTNNPSWAEYPWPTSC